MKKKLPSVAKKEAVMSKQCVLANMNGCGIREMPLAAARARFTAFEALLAVAKEADRREDVSLGLGGDLWKSLVDLDAAFPGWRTWPDGD